MYTIFDRICNNNINKMYQFKNYLKFLSLFLGVYKYVVKGQTYQKVRNHF